MDMALPERIDKYYNTISFYILIRFTIHEADCIRKPKVMDLS